MISKRQKFFNNLWRNLKEEDFLDDNDRKSYKNWKVIDNEDFFEDPLTLATSLIGKILLRKTSDGISMVRINEVEAYLGLDDDACHSYGGKITERTKVFYKKGGTIYVFLIYGMYNCLNFIAGDEKNPSAVLIRGADPIYGEKILWENRYKDKKVTSYRIKNFLNGPGKLCLGLNIDKSLNGKDILSVEYLLLIDDGKTYNYKKEKRVGIDYATLCKDELLRFIKI